MRPGVLDEGADKLAVRGSGAAGSKKDAKQKMQPADDAGDNCEGEGEEEEDDDADDPEAEGSLAALIYIK